PAAALCAAIIIRKLRFRRMPPSKVEIVGGVPIRPSRVGASVVGAYLVMLGGVLVAFGPSTRPVIMVICWLPVVGGCATLLGVTVGWLPVGHIRLDPPGITIGGHGWAYTVPWDGISRMVPGEISRNPALFIWIRHLDVVTAHPPKRRERVI